MKSWRTRRRSQRGTLISKWRRQVAAGCCPRIRTRSHFISFVFHLKFYQQKGYAESPPIIPPPSAQTASTDRRVQATRGSKGVRLLSRTPLPARARAHALSLCARAHALRANATPPCHSCAAPTQSARTPTLGLPRRFLWVFRCLDARLRSRCRAPLPGVAHSPPLRADTCLRPSTGPKAVLIVKKALALERAEQLRCAAHPSRSHTRIPHPALPPGPAARPPRRPRPGPNCTQPPCAVPAPLFPPDLGCSPR